MIEGINDIVDGHTALSRSLRDCFREEIEPIKYLLENGADPNIQPNYGRPNLEMVVDGHPIEILKLFLEADADPNYVHKEHYTTALLYCCRTKDRDKFDMLLKYGAKVRVTDRYNRNALYQACRYGNLELIKWLVEKRGFDVKYKVNGRGLLYNIHHHYLDVIKYLAKRGATF